MIFKKIDLIFLGLVIFLKDLEVEGNNETDALFQNYWEFILSSSPVYATSQGDTRFNNKMDNYSLAFYEEQKINLLNFQNQAEELLANQSIEGMDRINLQFLVSEINYKLIMYHIENYLFPITHLEGPPHSLIALLDYHHVNSIQDVNDLIARYNAFPQQVEDIINLLREGIRKDMVLNEKSLKNYETMILSLTNCTVEESTFYAPFKKIVSLVPPEEVDYYLNKSRTSVIQSLNPALEKLSDFVKNEYRQHLRPNIGLSSLPNGRQIYEALLLFYTTPSLTPEEIHMKGIEELARIKNEMEKVIQELGFNDTVREFNDRLRSNSFLHFNTSEEAISTYTDYIFNVITPKLLQIFKKIPSANLKVKKVPEEVSGSLSAFYSGSKSGSTFEGIFYIDTSVPAALSRYRVTTLSLHEALPGHHFQDGYVNEVENIPLFRKSDQYPLYASFSEGWALYSEYLGRELGLYEDKLQLYGTLEDEMLRACRLVVDTGIHALNWSRQQAINLMLENTANSQEKVENEIDRYITWPGQACAYKIGELKIKELRSKAEKELGQQFDLKEFHDVLLSNPGPLSFLEVIISDYIIKKKTLSQ